MSMTSFIGSDHIGQVCQVPFLPYLMFLKVSLSSSDGMATQSFVYGKTIFWRRRKVLFINNE